MFLRSIGCLLFSLIMITEQSVAMNHQMNTSMDSHESVESKLIDQDWEDRILETTNALFLLKKTMLAASKFDLNPLRYSPDIRLDLIRYPDSMRSTLLEISNEVYRSFLRVHSTTNRIHLYSEQIPLSIKLVSKLMDSQQSKALIRVQTSTLAKGIVRIGTTITALLEENTESFDDLQKLLNRVLELTSAFEIQPLTKSSDQLQQSNLKFTKKKPKKQRKGKSRKDSNKPINITNDATISCETLPENLNENAMLIMNTTKTLLSVSKSFSNGQIPIPKSHDFFKILTNLTNLMDYALEDWSDSFNEISQTLLKQSFSLSVLSKTYYTISKKFIMSPVARLSLMLTAAIDNARKSLLTELCTNRSIDHNEIKMFIKEQRQNKIQTV